MSNVYVGFDFSLVATGYAVIRSDGGIIETGTIKTSPQEAMPSRLVKIADAVVEILDRHQPDYACKESPAFGFSGAFTRGLEEVHGAVAYAVAKSGRAPLRGVAPSTLKKYATGSGRAEKSDVKVGIFKRWGIELKDNNQADAYIVARIAGGAHGGLPGETEEQREVIVTVKKGAL